MSAARTLAPRRWDVVRMRFGRVFSFTLEGTTRCGCRERAGYVLTPHGVVAVTADSTRTTFVVIIGGTTFEGTRLGRWRSIEQDAAGFATDCARAAQDGAP